MTVMRNRWANTANSIVQSLTHIRSLIDGSTVTVFLFPWCSNHEKHLAWRLFPKCETEGRGRNLCMRTCVSVCVNIFESMCERECEYVRGCVCKLWQHEL